MELELSWAAPFRRREQELAFLGQEGTASRRLDQLCGKLCWGLFLLTCWRFRRNLALASVLRGLGLGLAYLLPWLWCNQDPASYSRHRLWVVTALRLLSLLIPAIDAGVQVVVPVDAPTSILGWLAVISFSIKLPRLLLLSLGFRLPFGLHLLVQGFQMAFYLRSLPVMCQLPFFQYVESRRAFDFAESLMEQLGALFSYTGGVARHLGEGQSCSCLRVTVVLMAVLGYIVPSFIVACGELGRRASFVSGRLHEGTWAQEDLQAYLLHDWAFASAIFVSLLPFIASLIWHAVALATLHWGFCEAVGSGSS